MIDPELQFTTNTTRQKMTFYETEIKRIRKLCFSNDRQLETVIATKNYIDNHFDQELKLDFLAHVRFTSKYHLLRIFKRYYGITPKQYLIDKRIEKAKEQLAKGVSVSETCVAVGFESLSSFSHLFKTKTGKTPSQYQAQKSNFQ